MASSPRIRYLAPLFRSLSTLISAGIPIHEGLMVLAESSEDSDSKLILEAIGDGVASGRTLSICMADHQSSFSLYLVGLIRVGEKTGALSRILDTIADHTEKSEALRLKLRSAVTYPAFLITGALLLMMLGPSYLLKGQLTMLKQSGQELPWLTKVMIFWSGLVSSPIFMIAMAGLVFAVFYFCTQPQYRDRILMQLHQLPVIRDFLRQVATARFARAMEISLRSGIQLLSALPLSAESAADPLLIVRMRVAKTSLMQGDTLSEALKDASFFSPSFHSLVSSGEESGKLPVMLALIAQFAELELELAIKRATILVEPMILLGMGIFTALVLVATLQPTIALLQAL